MFWTIKQDLLWTFLPIVSLLIDICHQQEQQNANCLRSLDDVGVNEGRGRDILTQCVTTVDPNRSVFKLTCDVYARTTISIPSLPNSPVGIWVTTYLESQENVDNLRKSNATQVCLKLVGARVRKMDTADGMEYLKHANEYYLDAFVFLPLLSITLLDTKVSFHEDKTVGFSVIDPECLSRQSSAQTWRCLKTTEVLKSVMTPGDNFKMKFTFEDLFTKDFLNLLLVFMNNLWLTDFNGTINSLALTMSRDFGILPREALKSLAAKRIEVLSFPNNAFRHVADGDLPSIPSLVGLDFSGCNIETIDTKAFDQIKNVRILNLGGNKLKRIPVTVRYLTELTELYLNGNRISDLESCFEGVDNESWDGNMATLQVLNLSDMRLKDPLKNVLKGSKPRLRKLLLRNCSLNTLENGTFRDVRNVIELDLSQNNLSQLTSEPFVMLTRLQTLKLSQNNFKNIRYDLIIDGVPSLTSFILSTNDLTSFVPLNLKKNTNLQMLDLSSNKIKDWQETKLQLTKNNSLSLDLSSNNISVLNDWMLKDFDKLRSLRLEGNRFDCGSCFLEDFNDWIGNTSVKLDFYSRQPYRCSFPKDLIGKMLTEVTVDPVLCTEQIFDWLLNVALPLIVFGIVLAVASTVSYIYRWYILYFYYLYRSRFQKQRSRNNEEDNYKYDAFVSYCTEDTDWILQQLIPSMEQQDPFLHLCIHERDFEIGETIMNNIIDCIDDSHKSIFLLSPSFIRSQWCQWELQMAQHKLFEDRRDVLILILLGEIDDDIIPKILKRLMKTRTYLIWSDTQQDQQRVFWTRLKHAIGPCRCTSGGPTRV